MNRKSKLHVLTALALVLGILLAGCGDTQPTEPPTDAPETAAPTEVPTEAPTLAPTEAPTEAEEDLTRNPLTGEVIDTLHTGRTFAVVFNNVKAALPQHGISQADMLFEFLAEGGVTRCVGLFSNIGDVEEIGSIRSARRYFISLAQAYDAILVHAGGSDEALEYIKDSGFNDIDGIKGYANSSFYRNQARLSAGYKLEHTLFTTGGKLLSCAEGRGHALERPDGVNYGLYFDENVQLTGDAANSITITYGIGNKQTFLDYNADAGVYLARQHGGAWVDGNTDAQLAFENVLVLYAATSYQDDNYLLSIDLTGSGKGYFACGGKIVPITWQRSGEDGMFFFSLEDGSPVTLQVGQTYVSVVPAGTGVDCE
ncbi:MAG: DUF3048 domain-containing protein [Oscillospiraceae bacterium]|nr:DUF3048 domain-containing protein [Oscillospiraceae bacterium]